MAKPERATYHIVQNFEYYNLVMMIGQEKTIVIEKFENKDIS